MEATTGSGIVWYEDSNKAYEEYRNESGETIRVINRNLSFYCETELFNTPGGFKLLSERLLLGFIAKECGIISDVVGDKDAVEFCCNEFIEIEMREGEFAIYAAPESLERVGKLFSCVRIEDLAKLVWPDVLLIQTRKPWCITVDADDWYKMPFMRIGCRVGVERVKNCKWVKVEV